MPFIKEFMSKDKVVDLVKKEDVKKALCTITVATQDGMSEFTTVAGYQLLEGMLIVFTQEGLTHLIPINNIIDVTITANKE